MIRGAAIVWSLLALAVGTGLFLLKYEVQGLEDRLARLNHEIRSDRAAVHVLEAEWSYLNDPARLRDLAERHLGLAPFTPAQVGTVAHLPLRPAPAPEAPAAPDSSQGTAPGGFGMVTAPSSAGDAPRAEVASAPGRVLP